MVSSSLEGIKVSGHTEDLHVGWSDEKLMDRKFNPTAYNSKQRTIAGSSSFTDKKTAEGAIREAIRLNMDEIKDWLSSEIASRLTLEHDIKKPIGRGIMNDEELVTDKTRLRVILQKAGKRFEVKTAFPIN